MASSKGVLFIRLLIFAFRGLVIFITSLHIGHHLFVFLANALRFMHLFSVSNISMHSFPSFFF